MLKIVLHHPIKNLSFSMASFFVKSISRNFCVKSFSRKKLPPPPPPYEIRGKPLIFNGLATEPFFTGNESQEYQQLAASLQQTYLLRSLPAFSFLCILVLSTIYYFFVKSISRNFFEKLISRKKLPTQYTKIQSAYSFYLFF